MVSKVLCNIVVDFGGWRANTPRVGDAPYAQTCCCQCQYHVANISCRLIEQVSFFFTSIPYARHYRNVTQGLFKSYFFFQTLWGHKSRTRLDCFCFGLLFFCQEYEKEKRLQTHREARAHHTTGFSTRAVSITRQASKGKEKRKNKLVTRIRAICLLGPRNAFLARGGGGGGKCKHNDKYECNEMTMAI